MVGSGFVGLEEVEDGRDGDLEVLCDVVWVGVGVEEEAAEGGACFGERVLGDGDAMARTGMAMGSGRPWGG